MENQSYYNGSDLLHENVAVADRYLVVNCAGCCVLPTPFRSRNDAGRLDFYLQYLSKGEMRVRLDGCERRMRPGDLMLYYPGEPYEYYTLDGDGPIEYLWVHFTGMGAADLVRDCLLPSRQILRLGAQDRIEPAFRALFKEFLLRDPCFEPAAAGRLLALCVAASRALPDRAAPEAAEQSRMFRAVSYLHTHYNEPLSVEQLAAAEHLSVSRFRALFKSATGLSPLQYLTDLRLRHARELMLRTDMPLKEIASAVGYPDPLYFSRVFKDKTGVAPSAFPAPPGLRGSSSPELCPGPRGL